MHLAEDVAGAGMPDKPALAAARSGRGEAPGLSPDEALRRLIQRAEQLRQMISATPAAESSSDQCLASTGTQDIQHGGKLSASAPAALAVEEEHIRASITHSAASSTTSGAQQSLHSTTAAAQDAATCASKADSAEQTQIPVSTSTEPPTGKHKRANDRALPVSKLRRVAEGKLVHSGRGRTTNPERATSSPLQVKYCLC